MSQGLEYPIDRFASPVLAFSPANLPTTPYFSASVAVWHTEKALSNVCSTIKTTNFYCIINSVFNTNPKHSLILSLSRKLTPAKTSAPAHYKLSICSKVENSSCIFNLQNSPCLISRSVVLVNFDVCTIWVQQAPDSQDVLPLPPAETAMSQKILEH